MCPCGRVVLAFFRAPLSPCPSLFLVLPAPPPRLVATYARLPGVHQRAPGARVGGRIAQRGWRAIRSPSALRWRARRKRSLSLRLAENIVVFRLAARLAVMCWQLRRHVGQESCAGRWRLPSVAGAHGPAAVPLSWRYEMWWCTTVSLAEVAPSRVAPCGHDLAPSPRQLALHLLRLRFGEVRSASRQSCTSALSMRCEGPR